MKILPINVCLFLLVACCLPAGAQGTAFTYQGRLNGSNGPVSGLYDFRFNLYDVASGGVALAGQDILAVPVSNGLFTATIDLGAAVWNNGGPRWLELVVHTNGLSEPPVTLSPRQPITSAPYAIRASLAGTAATVQAGGVNAAAIADGATLAEILDDDGAGSGLNADFLDGLDSLSFAAAAHNHYGQTWSGAATTGLRVETTAGGAGTAALRGRQGASGVMPADPTGVWGESSSGNGVVGTSVSGMGVYGSSSNWTGVHGFTLAGPVGVLGRSDSTTGKGVWGQGASSTGTNYGVQGTSYSPDGIGVYGKHEETTGTSPGVLGETDSISSGAVAILGRVVPTSPGGSSAGVRGINEGIGSLGIGVWGSQNGNGWGVYGTAIGGRGVYGAATGTTEVNYGVYGATSSTNGYGVYAVGDTPGGVALRAAGSGIIESTADSYVFHPGNQLFQSELFDTITIHGGTTASTLFRESTSTATNHTISLPLTIPTVLYGKPTRLEAITIYYRCQNGANNFIYQTDLVHPGSPGDILLSDTTDRTSNVESSYTLNVNHTFSANDGFLGVLFYLRLVNNTDWVQISGVRLRFGHD